MIGETRSILPAEDVPAPVGDVGGYDASRHMRSTRQISPACGLTLYGLLLFGVTAVAIWAVSVGQGVVMIWPSVPIVIAKLMRWPIRQWPKPVAVTIIAFCMAGLVLRVPPLTMLAYVAIDVAVALLVAALLHRLDPDPRSLRGYGWIIVTSLLGAAISTMLATPLLWATSPRFSAVGVAQWFAANAMGLIVLLPALKATRRALSEELRILSPALLLPIGVSALVALLVFSDNGYPPMLFLLLPCGVFAALLFRFVGAALSTLAIAIVATANTMNGIGPIAAAFVALPERTLFLQLLLGIVTLTAFPVAALLYEQARALDEIRDTERQLRMLTDYSTDLIERIGPDGIRRYASPASARLLGYRPDEMVGISPYTQIHPDDRDRVRRKTTALIPGGDSTVFRYRMRHRDGQYVWLEGAFRLVGDGPNTGEVIGSIRDLAERRAIEDQAIEATTHLEERQRLLALAENAARIGHWRLNLSDQNLLWSPETFRIHGLPPGEAPDLSTAIDYYHPEDRTRVREAIHRVIISGGSFSFDARLVRPDGSIRWVTSRGQAERHRGAGVIGIFGILQDTTEQVEAMSALRAAREAAERALAAKATFTATISHEIRTPLTSILAAAQLLRDTPGRDERMRHLDALEQAGRTLSDIVDDVLTFSKLEGGHGDPELIPFEPRALLATVAGMFAAEAGKHDVSLTFDASEGVVVGDPARVQRVLTNLVGNAVKFTRAGSVRMTAMRGANDLWRFEVVDDGVGIRDDRLASIFEPFVQADASITRSYGGTGLGLSISRMLVDSMGGTIAVASRPDHGSRFWFELPLPPAEAAPDAAQSVVPVDAGAPVSPPSPAATVLVAEDNDTNRFLIAELVRRLGHHVVSVENGARAVEYVTALAGNSVDIVLMDVQMPVMDGIAATRAIRAWSGAGASVPIYALTADQSAERREAIAEAGMNGMLTKPVDLRLLRSVLEQIAPCADAGPVAGGDDALDPRRIQSLTDALGPAQRDTLLALLIEDAGRVPARLRTLVAHGQLGLARREAHALRGAAASMGAVALIEALQVVEGAEEDATIDPAALDAIDRCAKAVIDAARRAMVTGDRYAL